MKRKCPSTACTVDNDELPISFRQMAPNKRSDSLVVFRIDSFQVFRCDAWASLLTPRAAASLWHLKTVDTFASFLRATDRI